MIVEREGNYLELRGVLHEIRLRLEPDAPTWPAVLTVIEGGGSTASALLTHEDCDAIIAHLKQVT